MHDNAAFIDDRYDSEMTFLTERIKAFGRALRKERRWSAPDRERWVDIALETGFSRIRDQQREVIRMRSQSVLFVTFLATAIALLVASGLASKEFRDETFYLLAGTGTALFAIVAILLILVVAPIFKFDFSLDPVALLRWLHGEDSSPNLYSAKHALATVTLPGMISHNSANLAVLRWFYGALLVAGVCSLGIWTWLVWAFA